MTRFTRLRPVNSLKHIVDVQGGLTVDTRKDEDLVATVETPVTTVATQIHQGSTVGSIFLNVQVSATSTAALANVYMYVMKNPGANFSRPNGNIVGTTDVRKFVIHQEMIMLQKETTGVPRTLFKGVIRLPPRLKRFGVNDVLIVSLYSPGVTIDYCIQCIYKEFR